MSEFLEGLRSRGCDVDGAMTRFLNNEALYARCYEKFFVDPSIDALRDALAAKDAAAAFRHAHTLKGVTANLGLLPLTKIAARIVEPLRDGEFSSDVLPDYDDFMRQLESFKGISGRTSP